MECREGHRRHRGRRAHVECEHRPSWTFNASCARRMPCNGAAVRPAEREPREMAPGETSGGPCQRYRTRDGQQPIPRGVAGMRRHSAAAAAWRCGPGQVQEDGGFVVKYNEPASIPEEGDGVRHRGDLSSRLTQKEMWKIRVRAQARDRASPAVAPGHATCPRRASALRRDGPIRDQPGTLPHPAGRVPRRDDGRAPVLRGAHHAAMRRARKPDREMARQCNRGRGDWDDEARTRHVFR